MYARGQKRPADAGRIRSAVALTTEAYLGAEIGKEAYLRFLGERAMRDAVPQIAGMIDRALGRLPGASDIELVLTVDVLVLHDGREAEDPS